MKIRILTGLVAGIFAIVLLLLCPAWAIRFVVAAILCIAMHELLAAGGCKHKGLSAAAYLFAAVCPFFDLLSGTALVGAALTLYVFTLAMIQIVCIKRLSFAHTAFVMFVSVAVILPLGSLAYLRALEPHGLAYLFLAVIIAWFSDMGAYFAGSFLGKHKLCPLISPKKTVEGFFGGIISAVLFSLLGAWIYQTAVLGAEQQVVYWQVALVALVIAPMSVVGDLFCSVIKRYNHIKDFGNLFPGHGGMLDRFDSVTFVAPMLYAVCSYLPLIQTI